MHDMRIEFEIMFLYAYASDAEKLFDSVEILIMLVCTSDGVHNKRHWKLRRTH